MWRDKHTLLDLLLFFEYHHTATFRTIGTSSSSLPVPPSLKGYGRDIRKTRIVPELLHFRMGLGVDREQDLVFPSYHSQSRSTRMGPHRNSFGDPSQDTILSEGEGGGG
jgi:hypothetical protein